MPWITKSRAIPTILVGLALTMFGCRPASGPPEVPKVPKGTSERIVVTVVVHAVGNANGGYPVHMMVRAIEADAVLTESYESAAEALFANPPDPTVLDKAVLFPGKRIQRSFETTRGAPLAAYFFVSDVRTPDWKLVLGQAAEPKTCIRLLGDRALREDCRKAP